MTLDSSHLPHPLQVALSSDPLRPRMTFYDDASGERVELSAQSMAGWVIKTMNLLIDDVGVEDGAEVSLHLPLHWLTAVWVLASDAVGARVGQLAAVEGPVAVVDSGFAEDRFAVSLRPMAMPLGSDCPAGMRDYCGEVRTMPDQLVQPPVSPGGSLAATAEVRAAELGLTACERVALLRTGSGPIGAADVVDGLLSALAVDGSAVWTRNPDAAGCVSRWQAEQVTAVLGPLPAGFDAAVPGQIRHLVQGTR